jgi:NCS1 family nucleobase:cation symporter-1
VALFSALTVGSDDPTAWMVPIGGPVLGFLALAFVALANVTTTAVSIFASGLALRHVRGLRERGWWQLVVVSILPCIPFVFWPHELADLGDAFLAYNGTLYAPIVGIVFVDYFLLRRQKVCLWSIFDDAPSGAYHYTGGFHWPAFASLVLGQAVYLFLYDPISGEAHALFRYAPASIAACVVPALTYGMAMRWMAGGAASEPTRRGELVEPNI